MIDNRDRWKVVSYDKKALEILKNAKLNKQQKDELDRCMKEVKSFQSDVFSDMYKLFVNEMAFVQISKYYNRNATTIHKLFKQLGINRNLKEAQAIAGKYRDYSKIRKTFKRTMKERYVKTQLFGSDVENLVRVELNQELNDLLYNGYEVVVGINSLFSMGELDIPIIIIKASNLYKFGLEVDNNYIHKNRNQRNKLKVSKFKKIGYHIFKLDVNATIRNDGHIGNIGNLQDDIKSVCNNIVNIVKK